MNSNTNSVEKIKNKEKMQKICALTSGFEPETFRLTAECSTNWAMRAPFIDMLITKYFIYLKFKILRYVWLNKNEKRRCFQNCIYCILVFYLFLRLLELSYTSAHGSFDNERRNEVCKICCTQDSIWIFRSITGHFKDKHQIKTNMSSTVTDSHVSQQNAVTVYAIDVLSAAVSAIAVAPFIAIIDQGIN